MALALLTPDPEAIKGLGNVTALPSCLVKAFRGETINVSNIRERSGTLCDLKDRHGCPWYKSSVFVINNGISMYYTSNERD